MEKKLQDQAWASLPEDTKEHILREYREIVNDDDQYFIGQRNLLNDIFGRHNLTAEEKPKFKIGDKVRMKMSAIEEERRKGGDWQEYVINKTLTVMLIKYLGHTGPIYLLVEENGFRYKPDWLEPYTEPTEKECGNLGEDSGNSHKPEDKELDLCELLKGCEGMEFYSPICGEIELEKATNTELIFLLDEEDGCTIEFNTQGRYKIGTLDDGGRYVTFDLMPSSELMLYPSKEVRTWDGWQPPKKRWKLKKGDAIFYVDSDFEIIKGECPSDDYIMADLACFRTQEQAEEAAKRVREVLEKYHDEIGE